MFRTPNAKDLIKKLREQIEQNLESWKNQQTGYGVPWFYQDSKTFERETLAPFLVNLKSIESRQCNFSDYIQLLNEFLTIQQKALNNRETNIFSPLTDENLNRNRIEELKTEAQDFQRQQQNLVTQRQAPLARIRLSNPQELQQRQQQQQLLHHLQSPQQGTPYDPGPSLFPNEQHIQLAPQEAKPFECSTADYADWEQKQRELELLQLQEEPIQQAVQLGYSIPPDTIMGTSVVDDPFDNHPTTAQTNYLRTTDTVLSSTTDSQETAKQQRCLDDEDWPPLPPKSMYVYYNPFSYKSALDTVTLSSFPQPSFPKSPRQF